MNELEPQLGLLNKHAVDFVIVGGVAVVAHGADYHVQIISLDKLIAAKRAAGRPKDLLVIPELEAILEIQKSES